MAKFKPLLGDLAGKIADNVFSRNTFGPYVRRRASPVNPGTEFQVLVRSWLAEASRYYSETLTAAQRLQWVNWAQLINRTDSLGSSYHLTGITAFQLVALNRRKVTDPYSYQPIPPVLATPPLDVATCTVTMGLAGQTVSVAFTPTPMPAKQNLLVYGTPTLPPGQRFTKKEYRFIDYAPPATASPFVITPRYLAKCGGWSSGALIKFKVKVLSTDSWLLSPGIDAAVVATP